MERMDPRFRGDDGRGGWLKVRKRACALKLAPMRLRGDDDEGRFRLHWCGIGLDMTYSPITSRRTEHQTRRPLTRTGQPEEQLTPHRRANRSRCVRAPPALG